MGIPGTLSLASSPAAVCSTFRQPLSVNSIAYLRASSACPSCAGGLGSNGAVADRRISSLCSSSSSSLSSSSSSSAPASPASFGGGSVPGFRAGRGQDCCSAGVAPRRRLSRSDRCSKSRIVVADAAARESGTISKEEKSADVRQKEQEQEQEDSEIRSQAAATFLGDDTIVKEQKVMSEKDETRHPDETVEEKSGVASTSSLEPRPKRINFDYGFQAKFLRTGPTVPKNVFGLASENFWREWKELRRTYSYLELKDIDPSTTEGGIFGLIGAYTVRGFVLFLRGFDNLLTRTLKLQDSVQPVELQVNDEQEELRQKLKKLVLSNKNVWDRERSREAIPAPWWVLGPYYLLCLMLDVIFNRRPIQRFWFLETVARMPYFSYISMLHLYETLGWWRSGAEVRKVHFAEEWNEMHHLKIMESLGGDLEWGDRFIGQHAAFFYYWILNFLFLVSPSVAYNFSELIEAHAVDTYTEFADANEELLKNLPPPPVAVAYYESDDLYMYDEFQTSNLPESRRPKMNNLYDVFMAVAGDENEHVKTMVACQKLDANVLSPHRVAKMRE